VNNKEPRTPEEQGKDLTRYYEALGHKQELLRRVARRDPQLALDMLRSSRWPLPDLPPQLKRTGFVLTDEQDLEQQIAAEAAVRDPQKALQLARESLAKGLSFQLLALVFRLNDKDQEIAAKFARDIIDKLHGRNLASDPFGGQITISLLAFSREIDEEKTANQRRVRRLKLDPEQRRDLVDLVTSAALAGSANSNLLFSITSVMAEVREFTPERVVPLQRKLATFEQTLNPDQKLWNQYGALREKGSPEDLLKFANTAGDQREQLEREAIELAVVRGRADSLRQLINSDIDSESRRRSLLDRLDSQQIDQAIERGDSEALQKLLPNIRRKEESARAMVEIALTLNRQGKNAEALELLRDAESLIKFDLTSETQTNALLGMVLAYALIDPPKAFSIIERTIDRANDDIGKALLLDKIVNTGLIQKGEIKLHNSQILPAELIVFRYGKGIAALANADFDRTKAAADRFDRNELRLLARLLLAQSLLQKPQNE
jgi:tetratricopeptide (TPR) repeat protein